MMRKLILFILFACFQTMNSCRTDNITIEHTFYLKHSITKDTVKGLEADVYYVTQDSTEVFVQSIKADFDGGLTLTNKELIAEQDDYILIAKGDGYLPNKYFYHKYPNSKGFEIRSIYPSAIIRTHIVNKSNNSTIDSIHVYTHWGYGDQRIPSKSDFWFNVSKLDTTLDMVVLSDVYEYYIPYVFWNLHKDSTLISDHFKRFSEIKQGDTLFFELEF